ncbi:MAG: aromatic amino acid transport family protein [Patescibacteria group bacterium]
MYKNILLPASILSGSIIGAGIFSLPFVFNKLGLLAGFLSLIIFAFIYALIYFIYADVVLRTEGEHRFIGYSKIYLGKIGFWVSIFVGLVQLLLVLIVYLILAPSFTQLIFGGSYVFHLLFFWLAGSLMMLFNTRKIAWFEFLIVLGIFSIIFLVFFFGVNNIDFSFIQNSNFNINSLGIVGVVIFALSGVMVVPEVVAYFRESASPLKFLKRSLLLGSFLPALAYIVFVLGILGFSKNVSVDAISGLVGYAPGWLIIFLGCLGFLSLASSYVLVSLNTRHIFEYDFSLSANLSKFLVIFIPPALYFLGIRGFTEVISFTGSIFIPLEIILLILIWIKANKLRPTNDFFDSKITKATLPFLLAVFLIVLVYEIIKLTPAPIL